MWFCLFNLEGSHQWSEWVPPGHFSKVRGELFILNFHSKFGFSRFNPNFFFPIRVEPVHTKFFKTSWDWPARPMVFPKIWVQPVELQSLSKFEISRLNSNVFFKNLGSAGWIQFFFKIWVQPDELKVFPTVFCCTKIGFGRFFDHFWVQPAEFAFLTVGFSLCNDGELIGLINK